MTGLKRIFVVVFLYSVGGSVGIFLTQAIEPQGIAFAATEITDIGRPDGVSVWLVRNDAIPIVTVEIAFRGGASLDPVGKEGLAHMVSGLLNEGAGPYDSLSFSERLKELAIGLDIYTGRDAFRIRLRTLSENIEEAFKLLSLVLNSPRFDEEAVERERRRILTYLSHQGQNPNHILERAWFAQAFPKHPYGRPVRGTKETISSIESADLRAFVRKRLARDNAIVGVVGDVTSLEIARLIDDVFGKLPEKSTPFQLLDATIAEPGSVSVIRKSIPQSVVMYGLRGVSRTDPDYYAAYLIAHILGGEGFSSRLYGEVREKSGLAYSVYSHLIAFRYAGLLVGGVATANDRVKDSLSIIRSEISKLGKYGVKERELADAKTFLNGSFPLQFTSSRGIARILVTMQLRELSIDYLNNRRNYINAVTRADIRRVAKYMLHPDRMIVVIVGDPKGIEQN